MAERKANQSPKPTSGLRPAAAIMSSQKMLQETSESTRGYIGFIAIFAFMPAIGQLTSYGKIDSPIAIFGLIFGSAYGYIALRWHVLLAKKPAHIRNVATANLILAALFAAYRLFQDRDWSILWGVVVAFGITSHIIAGVGQYALKSTVASTEKREEANRATESTRGK